MRKEHRELRRRPLLTPLWLLALAVMGLVTAVVWFLCQMTTTTVVIVPNAEREFSTIEDPPLSTAGEERAQLLARLFGDRTARGKIAAVLAVDTRRSQTTAEPLASRLGLKPVVVPFKEQEKWMRRIPREYQGRNVLIVSHPDAIPGLIRGLSQLEGAPALREDDTSTIYIVTVPTLGRASLLKMSY